jgi:predicted dehydrogenase
MPEPVCIGVVGCGYWGPNLVRSFDRLPEARVGALCDASAARLERLGQEYPAAARYTEFEQFLEHPGLDAVALATSAPTHYRLARRSLEQGKPTFVEKPLTLASSEARELAQLAEGLGLPLMVGHLLEYHPAVEYLRELAASGALGDLRYLYSQRLNLGQVRQQENALWSLAPHDIAVTNFLLGAEPQTVTAVGQSYLTPGVADVAFLTLFYPEHRMAHIHVSWLDPHKTRKLTLVGSVKMAVFDDMEASEKVRLYDKGVDRPPDSTADAEIALKLRFGDILIPRLEAEEPLVRECRHFVECVRGLHAPRSDGRDGVCVVATLEAAQRSLEAGGAPQAVAADDDHHPLRGYPT